MANALVKGGVAASAAGVSGFAFGLYSQLGLKELLRDDPFYAVTILCFVTALILVTARATLDLEGARKQLVVDAMIGFSVLITAVGVSIIFYRAIYVPAQVNVYAKFIAPLPDGKPILTPQIYVGHKKGVALNSDPVALSIERDGDVAIDILNLGELVNSYQLDEMKLSQNVQALHSVIAQQQGVTLIGPSNAQVGGTP